VSANAGTAASKQNVSNDSETERIFMGKHSSQDQIKNVSIVSSGPDVGLPVMITDC
jgi:hypothetical protein